MAENKIGRRIFCLLSLGLEIAFPGRPNYQVEYIMLTSMHITSVN